MPFLHSVRDIVVRVKARTRLCQEGMSGKTGRHQWTKGSRLKEATTSEEGEDSSYNWKAWEMLTRLSGRP
jgi:hypothetical protein